MTRTEPARGMRDFLPEDVRRREYVIGIIKKVYERYGYEPLETPAVENIETLMGKYGDEGNQLIFKILMRGEHEASGKADLASCPGCSSATRFSQSGGRIVRPAADSASSTSATLTRLGQRHRLSRPNCATPCPTCCWNSASPISRFV
jgi:hypothetical protein